MFEAFDFQFVGRWYAARRRTPSVSGAATNSATAATIMNAAR